MLISTNKPKKTWVIPKSMWTEGDDVKDIVKAATWEEAGVVGIVRRRIGKFVERVNNRIKAYHLMYEIESQEVSEIYPQSKKRERRWFTYQEAMMIVKDKHIRDALRMSSVCPPILALQTSKKIEYQESQIAVEKKNKKKKKIKQELGYSVDEASVPENPAVRINEALRMTRSEIHAQMNPVNGRSLSDVCTETLKGLSLAPLTQNPIDTAGPSCPVNVQPISTHSSISKKSQKSETSNTFTEDQLSQSTGKTSCRDSASSDRRKSWTKFIPLYKSKSKNQEQSNLEEMQDMNLEN
ncbi:hypothetical protein CLU79DRAFT_575838 [Phycomyces nitens]|nr:hypothetical protein CLU79DRAFT_575838 [Phycomyces nitens]